MIVIRIVFTFFILTSLIFSQNINPPRTQFAFGAQIGIVNGVGGQIYFLTDNFADNFPFSAKIGMSLSFLDAGDPIKARRIFINNNTNGIPEKNGKTLGFNLDFLYRYKVLGLKKNYFYFGPRFLMFTGNFNFIGGNEDFDVTTDQWGIGVGIENYFKIVPEIDLVINLGYNYFTTSTLYGHDTSYNPDGANVNPRENYTYNEADKAINQPKHQINALIGFSYNFH